MKPFYTSLQPLTRGRNLTGFHTPGDRIHHACCGPLDIVCFLGVHILEGHESYAGYGWSDIACFLESRIQVDRKRHARCELLDTVGSPGLHKLEDRMSHGYCGLLGTNASQQHLQRLADVMGRIRLPCDRNKSNRLRWCG